MDMKKEKNDRKVPFFVIKLMAFISLLHIFRLTEVQADEITLDDFEAKLDFYMEAPNFQTYMTERDSSPDQLPEIRIPAVDYSRTEEMEVTVLDNFEGDTGQSLLTD